MEDPRWDFHWPHSLYLVCPQGVSRSQAADRAIEGEKMDPIVSVIVPAYNAELYIEEALKSIFEQTFHSYEIIVVDDGSKDRTSEIVHRFADRLLYIRQENSGPSKARNTGIQSARGKYIAFLDADDLWTKNKLELQIGFLETHPDIGMTFADMMTFNENDVTSKSHFQDIKRKNPYLYDILVREQNDLKDIFLMLLKGNFIPTGTVVIRKSCLDQAGLFDESISSVEDLDMWMRISMFCKVCFLPYVLEKKREHESNISKDHYKAACCAIYVREKLLKKYPEFTEKYRGEFDKKLSKSYFKKGYWNFSVGRLKEARENFIKSLDYRKNFRALIYALSCFLPTSLIHGIRRIKNIGKE